MRIPLALRLAALFTLSGFAPSPSASGAPLGRAWGGTRSEPSDTTIAFDKGGVVNIENESESIVVTSWSDDRVRIRSSAGVVLNATRSHLTVRPGTRRGDARIEITVPQGARVIARTQSGDIAVRKTKGEVDATTQAGDVELTDVGPHVSVHTLSGAITITSATGDVRAQSVNDDVTVTDVHGNIDIGSVSGSLVIRRAMSKVVRARTTSGDVSYEGAIDPDGIYELTTHSGDAHLTLPRDAGAEVTVSTWQGSIDSDFPITLRPGEHGIGTTTTKRFTFQIGKGGARITAETFSGDITISSRGTGR